ncbi:PREDICTED: UBX domain-containing protein 1 [Tarenaya hassleriana]|uniref:UBX domain-containing protein 1 n=1 Tax=Tarenaya hassleriana TaxID=28532 RepID=UPI00053C87AD|nr:PREDICTED: UBX domain-containing protein 1 [Tarenaya hassleriana]
MQAVPETAVVEVNLGLLKELEGFGFPRARAAWALHYSGNTSVESAVNWIVDHESDSQFDDMPLMEFNIEIESSSPSDDTMEAKQARVKELREQASKKREEEERKRGKEREKERIRAGKELSEAKRVAEENERKRNIALRKAEKDEEKRARERVLQKLEADKMERKRMLGGFPTEVHSSSRSPPSAPPESNIFLPSSRGSVSKAEEMRECLRSLRRNLKDEEPRVARRAFETLLVLVRNVAKNPDEEKYRRIRLGNPLFHERVGRFGEGIEFLELCGFTRQKETGGFLNLPRDQIDISRLREAASQLNSALTNPFFGVLSS